ncbi:threonine/serine exporter ThrE family protein [Leifsonia sp. 71-9]|uniref:threonine/serine ThrE exporter family protein n=1 Tax=Leifsonia sp. 71-9 TaxID=1895934 RepID=UPI000A9485F1|nr:threonine/serine exporter family protein [Leifsonia sp. 71-9]
MSGIQDRVRGALVALIKPPPERLPLAAEIGVPEMVGALGPALLSSSQATSDVQETLERVAAAYERPDLRVFVLPTLVIVEDPGVVPSHTAIYPANNQQLRLDQAGAVDHVVRHAAAHRDEPNAVVAEIRRIEDRPPRFGAALTIFGHLLLTLGFGLVLNPTVAALPVYAVLGAIVGTIVTFGTRMPTLSLILPVFTAFVVTLVTSYAADAFIHDDVLRLVAPALVSFLPGLTLTIAAVELTSGQVMAGASRLVYGIARLALLAFGVFAAIVVTGHPAQVDVHAHQLGGWAPWVGILLVSVGYYFFSAAPRRSLVWILYALVVAYAAQLLGNLLLGPELSGLVGAAIVVPAVYLAARIPAAPPVAIMLTCAYWLLVPGAMGFIGLSEAAAGAAGATNLILQTFGSLIAIATGMLIGAGVSRDATAVARGWRQPG